MRRTEYRCRYCAQSSSRRWNMKIHIQRRHASMLGEGSIRSQLQSSDSQVFSNIGNSLYKTNNDYLKYNYNYSYVHQEDPPSSKNYYHNDPLFFEQQGQSQEHKKDSLSKMGDSMRDMYYAIRTVVEIKNMSKQFQSSYSPPPDPLTHLASIHIMQPLKGINRTPMQHY